MNTRLHVYTVGRHFLQSSYKSKPVQFKINANCIIGSFQGPTLFFFDRLRGERELGRAVNKGQ